MRLILLFLFPLLLNAQQDTIQSIFNTDNLYPLRIISSERTEKVLGNIMFSDENKTVVFSKTNIDLIQDSLLFTVTVDTAIYFVVEKAMTKTFDSQYKETQQLKLKILFYEKHFGKLEGNLNSDCVKFIPVENPPMIEPCKKK